MIVVTGSFRRNYNCYRKVMYQAVNKSVLQNVRLVESALISSDEIGDIEIIIPKDRRW